MIRPLEARRLTGLTALFVGLLIAFSALAFVAQGRFAPTVAALTIGIAVCAFAVWWLWRVPPAVPDEHRNRDTTS
jgi:hypothetical protein